MDNYRLFIVGAGGFGREVHGWITRDPTCIQLDHSWHLEGFLDANPSALANYDLDLPIIGDPLTFIPGPLDRFVCAIGDPVIKLRVCRDLKIRGAQFATMISSRSYIGPRCKLGEGCVVISNSILVADITLGDFVMLNVSATVGHDAIIGHGSTLSGHTDVTGAAKLGEGVFLGSHATVAPSVIVGDYARIGASSVAVKNVPSYTTVLGVPAKKIFTRLPKD